MIQACIVGYIQLGKGQYDMFSSSTPQDKAHEHKSLA